MDNVFFAVVLEAAYTLDPEDKLGREDFLRKLCRAYGKTYWKDAR